MKHLFVIALLATAGTAHAAPDMPAPAGYQGEAIWPKGDVAEVQDWLKRQPAVQTVEVIETTTTTKTTLTYPGDDAYPVRCISCPSKRHHNHKNKNGDSKND